VRARVGHLKLGVFPGLQSPTKGNKFMTYRETPDAIYLLSNDGQSWVPITEAELAYYPWIEPQLY
jgi:hypothetical protein